MPAESRATTTGRRHRSVVVVMATLVVMATCDATAGASSNFYYDNWQCSNYLSAETVIVQSPAGQLLEIHIRDDIPVSTTSTAASCLSTTLTNPGFPLYGRPTE